MMRSFWILPACLLACSESSAPPAKSAPAPAVTVPIAPTAEPAPVASAEPAAPIDPDAGSACTPMASGLACRMCMADGSVLLEIVLADTVPVPETVTLLSRSPRPTQFDPRRLEWTIAATPEELVARVFTCPGCRRPMGWGFRIPFVRLAKLSAGDARALQRALGYPETPRLDGFEAWRSAKPAGAPLRQPELPGCAESR